LTKSKNPVILKLVIIFRKGIEEALPYSASKLSINSITQCDQLCGLVWSEFLATNPEVLGSIPGPTRFSEK
jgi:hypothetical protein